MALRNFRRAKGLCYTCGEKWAKDHKCQGTVQLHVVQEVVDLSQQLNSEDTEFEDASELMCLSAAALGDKKTSESMQVEIFIEGKTFPMLID